MDYLPLFLDVKQKPCLIVGGGVIAERKVSIMLRSQANLTVIAPEITAEIQRKVKNDNVVWLEKKFAVEDLNNYKIVIAATDDKKVNAEIAQQCRVKNILVNAADDTNNCDFILPSIIDRSPVQIAVSTGGASPVLARMLRTKLENCTPAAYGHLAKLIEDNRSAVKEKFSTVDERRKFWEQVLQGPIAELVFANQHSAADKLLLETINSADSNAMPKGEVYLVGAGPGDPDLLTFRALRLMQQADVVVYDRLVSEEIMGLVRKDAEHIYAGKERSQHAIPQETINEMLVRLAKQGKRVLRLKGGDPFIFGRGGEEIATLVDEKVPFQVVPGITAATGCASYAGIPLTHRDHAMGVSFWTGHMKDGQLLLPWAQMSMTSHTHVIFMGLKSLPQVAQELCRNGMSPDTPAAMISAGTTPAQKTVVSTIAELPARTEEQALPSPALLIVGDVVGMHNQIGWYKGAELPLESFPFPSHV